MTLSKWNNEKRIYEPYEVPNDWNVITYSSDMNEMVNCPHCGKRLTFGDCYTSREFYRNGFGYAVCEDCYYKES